MNRLILLFCVFLTFKVSSGFGQEVNLYLGEKDAAKATDAMAKDLGLAEEQKSKVLEINTSYFNSFAQIEASDKLNPDERIGEIVKITEKKDAAMQEVLTEKQLAIFDKKHHEARAFGFKKITREVQALQNDIRDYFDANIRPALIQHRNTLDGHLDPDEKEEVVQIRKDLKKVKGQIEEESRKIMHEIVHGTVVPEEEKMIYDSLLGLEEGLFDQAERIADQYGEEIDEVLSQIELHQKKWHKELEAIIGQHVGASADQYINPAHFLHVKTKYLRAGFMLFDPHEEIIPKIVEFDHADKPDDHPISANVTPNPANRENMLDFSVFSDGEVKVDQYNKDGSFRRHIFSGHVDSGHYSIKVQLESEKEGSYYFLISAGEVHHMERFWVKK